MPNSYTITVKNQTGGQQNYNFFSANPIVSGGTSGPIWTNIMKSAPHTPNGAVVEFDVVNNYFAICGNFKGTPTHGGRISVSKSVSIDLGQTQGSTIKMGSSINLSVDNKETCDLGAPTTPGKGKLGNYQLDTTVTPGNEFTIQDANNNNLLVGIATSEDGSITTAMGTFNPYPNATYQIMPQAIFYVATGDIFAAGTLVKVEMLGASMAVDFNARGTNQVTLTHNANNEFEFTT